MTQNKTEKNNNKKTKYNNYIYELNAIWHQCRKTDKVAPAGGIFNVNCMQLHIIFTNKINQ